MDERRVRIAAGSISVEALLDDSRTAQAIWEGLPIAARAETWGDEIYFSIPLKIEAESPREIVQIGDLGYWPPGSAFCIFFGPTPMSRGDEIRPASPVNVFGRVVGNPAVLREVRAGTPLRVERQAESANRSAARS